ncbi:YegP family protein [Chromohalobacter sp.]|uniref:YegP family protein n=1 Tax=Chromohalobacter sp. TaxID=50740 RepID=UPI003241E723
MPGYYDLKKNAQGQYHFTLKAGNHEVILSSETYASKQGAENGIDSCRTNSPHDNRYDRRTAINNSPYFVLKAGNGEVIGTSEMYSSAQARDNGIDSCKANGQGPTHDNT